MVPECDMTECPLRDGVANLKRSIDHNTEKLHENAQTNRAILSAFSNAVPLKLVIVIIVVIFMAKSANELVEHMLHPYIGLAQEEDGSG